ncbi:P-II family nitrogen regulator [Desulfococcaceae bacterium HSG9]|nr:P-II family nitrogen regulator [Desulfococcaceae bacterium HSG9]
MRFKLILSSVKPDITDHVVDAAKGAGATGATIIPARGTGIKEAKSFFGLSLEAQTDIVMLLVEEHLVINILNAIKEAGEFHKPGTGIAFAVPVEHVAGLESQMEKFEEEVRKSYF